MRCSADATLRAAKRGAMSPGAMSPEGTSPAGSRAGTAPNSRLRMATSRSRSTARRQAPAERAICRRASAAGARVAAGAADVAAVAAATASRPSERPATVPEQTTGPVASRSASNRATTSSRRCNTAGDRTRRRRPHALLNARASRVTPNHRPVASPGPTSYGLQRHPLRRHLLQRHLLPRRLLQRRRSQRPGHRKSVATRSRLRTQRCAASSAETAARSCALLTSGPGGISASATQILMPCSSARSCSSRSRDSSVPGGSADSAASASTL